MLGYVFIVHCIGFKCNWNSLLLPGVQDSGRSILSTSYSNSAAHPDPTQVRSTPQYSDDPRTHLLTCSRSPSKPLVGTIAPVKQLEQQSYSGAPPQQPAYQAYPGVYQTPQGGYLQV